MQKILSYKNLHKYIEIFSTILLRWCHESRLLLISKFKYKSTQKYEHIASSTKDLQWMIWVEWHTFPQLNYSDNIHSKSHKIFHRNIINKTKCSWQTQKPHLSSLNNLCNVGTWKFIEFSQIKSGCQCILNILTHH